MGLPPTPAPTAPAPAPTATATAAAPAAAAAPLTPPTPALQFWHHWLCGKSFIFLSFLNDSC
jgi:hypothetical protein